MSNKDAIKYWEDLPPHIALLAEAQDRHLCGECTPCGGWLLRRLHVPLDSAWTEQYQHSFEHLIKEHLLVGVSSHKPLEGSDVVTLFSPSMKGLSILQDIALSREWSVQVEGCRWHNSHDRLSWELPMDAWEIYEGEIHGEVRFDSNPSQSFSAVLADVEMFRLNQTVLERQSFDMKDSFQASDGLEGYAAIVPKFEGLPRVEANDLLEFAGHEATAGGGALIIHRLQLRSLFVGLGLGRLMLGRLVMRYMPEGGLVALQPYPLQFGREGDVSESEFTQAKKSLESYYFRLGFSRHPGAPDVLVCSSQMLTSSALPSQVAK